MTTIAERIRETKGRSTGFDYLRIMLALSVVCVHAPWIAYGDTVMGGIYLTPVRPLIAIILPAFFSLSGYLVAGSLDRTRTLLQFLSLRVARIFPALVVEIFLSALILGPLLTTYSLHAYFTDPRFWAYWWNMTGNMHYVLPGVFEHNPIPVVNRQLWTVPWELECYIALALLAVLGAVRRRYLLLAATAFVSIALPAKIFIDQHFVFHLSNGPTPGRGLVLAFLFGVVIHRFQDRLPWSRGLFIAAMVITLIGLELPLGDYVVMAPAAYMTVYLGLLNPKKRLLLLLGDLSYGIFLYGVPIQQLVYCLGMRQWYSVLALGIPLAIGFAYLSWNIVEKPTLNRRERFLAGADWISSVIDALVPSTLRTSFARLTARHVQNAAGDASAG